jgi:DNA repair protein RadC
MSWSCQIVLGECNAGRKRQKKQRDMFDDQSDRELLFMLLRDLMPWSQAATVVTSLIEKYGSFAEVIAAPRSELAQTPDLHTAAISTMKAVETAACRLTQLSLKQTPILNSWKRLTEYLICVMARDRREVVRVLYLDIRNRLIVDEVICSGDVKGVNIYPRLIMSRALEVHATALILAHNHSSGDPTPSTDDVEATRILVDAAKIFGVEVHDHIVVGRSGCLSLKKVGLMSF